MCAHLKHAGWFAQFVAKPHSTHVQYGNLGFLLPIGSASLFVPLPLPLPAPLPPTEAEGLDSACNCLVHS